jgi:hypothetical protein
MWIKEANKREGEQGVGLLRAAWEDQGDLRAWPPARRKMQRWGRDSRFLTRIFLPKSVFSPEAALLRQLSMISVE